MVLVQFVKFLEAITVFMMLPSMVFNQSISTRTVFLSFSLGLLKILKFSKNTQNFTIIVHKYASHFHSELDLNQSKVMMCETSYQYRVSSL